jgi:hypothetical protein
VLNASNTLVLYGICNNCSVTWKDSLPRPTFFDATQYNNIPHLICCTISVFVSDRNTRRFKDYWLIDPLLLLDLNKAFSSEIGNSVVEPN